MRRFKPPVEYVVLVLAVLVTSVVYAATGGFTTFQALTASPSAVSVSGVTAAEGSSRAFARADHTHSLTGTLPVANGGTGATSVANNLFFGGPSTGGPLAPTFRALVASDVPNLDTAKTTTGVFPVARGGTGSATVANNLVFAGPSTGGPLAPSFRLLVAGDVPALPASIITSGTFADTFLTSAYSGVGSCAASNWIRVLTRNTAPTCFQPAFTDLTGSASAAQIPFLDGSKISTGNLSRPVSLNSGETTFGTDALLFNTNTAGVDFGLTHVGALSLHSLSTAIYIDSSSVGVVFSDLSAFTGIIGVNAGVLTTVNLPTILDQTFTAWAPAGLAGSTIFAQRVYLNASTLTTASNYTTVVAGSGAGNYVLKLCGSSTCVVGNTYLTCTITCASTAGTVTSCAVNKAVTAALTLDWVVATACATTNPAGNATAYTTTP